ncbi:hypothetical protein JOD63_002624 [Microbacterium terrae]|uniref:Uncharacterized protein n=1 Tax=Microbacterium terrae TaxID=69369 RepID=A0A0M2HI06_9MICO|nr:hypothetical protein [Microbacterium terrae]KJL43935.1 hypothetical protein RS81_00728 [Microbacterium terrae]MBP1078656.1 hypothetical protein [Microbacterium terrae]
MILAIAVLALGLAGGVCAVVAVVRDSRSPLPTLRSYDTRHPLP